MTKRTVTKLTKGMLLGLEESGFDLVALDNWNKYCDDDNEEFDDDELSEASVSAETAIKGETYMLYVSDQAWHNNPKELEVCLYKP
jgi:hypothetical protein